MPRAINAEALAKLATNFGTEPINIVQIQWVDGGPRDSYADRDIPGSGVKGKILEIGGLDAIIQVSNANDSSQLSVKLSDIEGELKTIVDTIDIHKRSVWVYQWFEGLDYDDKFLIFKGQINSPVEWNESDRTLGFDVISKIEDVEVGFSIEEGDFADPPENLIGQPWPLCFGTVINVPALKAKSVRQGILATGNGIKDFTLFKRLEAANALICPMDFKGFQYAPLQGIYLSLSITPIYETNPDCAKRKCEAIESLELQIDEQSDFEFNTMTIFGGERFPQNTTITLDINGGKFTGRFSGNVFTVTGRRHPKNDGNNGVIIDDDNPSKVIESQCGPKFGDPNFDLAAYLNDRFKGHQGCEDARDAARQGLQTICAKASKATWDYYQSLAEAGFFWANAGDTVTLDSDQEVLYIANILPSTVLRVAAFRELNGGRQLLTVPDAYYTVRQTDYTSYDVCEIVFDKPLSTQGDGWEDDIYVTLTSSVGPNTVDIIRWFIEFYTDYAIDETSFDAVELLVENYPMHFPLLVRKNIITVLQEIAYQARCALWLRDDTFYIKYLSTTPTVDDTITEDDVDAKSLVLSHTPTEDLVTKYVAEWKKDYSYDDPNKVILRHNVIKYGTHEQVYDYYCFNIHELVVKTATFWILRTANTWRRATFTTPINKMNLEVFDTVDVTLPDLGDGTFKAIVEKASYNSDSRTMEFEVWTPMKSGTRTPYDFAWPADVQQNDLWPTEDERIIGIAGAGRGPNFSTIAPNNHPLSNRTTLSQGFQMGGCTTIATATTPSMPCRSDFGDPKPSDAGDVKPTPKASADQNGQVNTGTSPITNTGNTSNTSMTTCCQQAMDMAKQAMEQAQQARAEAQQARDDANADDKEDQPGDEDPDEAPATCGGRCTSTVKFQTIVPTLIVKPDGFFGNEPGDQGSLAIGTPTNSKCYTFNSMEAANQFAEMIQADIDQRSDGKTWTIGQEQNWLIQDNGNPPDPEGGEPCEPDETGGAIVGFTKESLT